MQDVLTLPSKKRQLRESVVTPRTPKSTEPSIQQLPGLAVHTNGTSSNGDTLHVKNGAKSASSKDPYPYGWRYIQTTTKEGTVEFSRVVLTAYDLLHPQEGDVIMHKPPHEKGYNYLHNSLSNKFKHKPKTFVSSDLRIDLAIPNTEPLVPGISVIFDVEEEKAWGTFYTQKEGTIPNTIFEITSPSTRENDFGKKHLYYAQAGVPYYVIVDIEYDPDDDNIVTGYSLHAFELVDKSYVELQPNEQGRYWMPSLEVWVGVNEEGVLCYDEQGELIMSYAQLDEALEEAEKRIREEVANAAEQKQIAQREAVRAAEQERIAQEEAARATEQERIAQEETARAAEQERIAQAEAARAAEQERITQEETARAVKQEQIAQKEATRAKQAEEENSRLRAIIEQLGGKA